ncbi:MAG: type II toxin-antitoxin system Phd/YefM family antitoxin [Longimicrobiales bacterium]
MDIISTAEARQNLAELVNRVAYGKERVVLTRHGKEIAAVVPVEDLTLVQKLRRFLRHREVDAALREVETRGGIAWEDLSRDLDL